MKVIVILLFSLIGIAGSFGVAWFGIRVNTFANSRTAFASLRGKLTLAELVGRSVELTWTTKNATSCDLQPGVGDVPLDGRQVVTPLLPGQEYSLMCEGRGGPVVATFEVAVVGVKDVAARFAVRVEPGDTTLEDVFIARMGADPSDAPAEVHA